MGTDREAIMRKAQAALESAKNGLQWFRNMYPESVDGSDDEADEEIESAIESLRTALAAPEGDDAKRLDFIDDLFASGDRLAWSTFMLSVSQRGFRAAAQLVIDSVMSGGKETTHGS